MVKGSHAPRVSAVCSRCGSPFERSAVHPYITECPACRGSKRAAAGAERLTSRKLRCPQCRALVSTDGGLGMRACPRCKEQWWSMPGGTWRNWLSDEVFHLGAYVGTTREETYRQILDKITPSML